MEIIKPIQSGLVAMGGPFKDTYKASPSRVVVSTRDIPSHLERVLKTYEKFVDQEFNWKNGVGGDWCIGDTELIELNEFLSPQDWKTFIELTTCFENHDWYHKNTGFFMTKLLQNACVAGVREVNLDFNGIKPFGNLGTSFPYLTPYNGQEPWNYLKDNHLSLTIQGMICPYAFTRAAFVDVSISNAGPRCFAGIRDAEVIIHNANEPETLFKESLGSQWNISITHNIKVKTPNYTLIDPFRKTISQIKQGELYFIDAQGKEERII